MKPPSPINPEKKKVIQQLLLEWFHSNKRDLPWRKTKDPYAILVSEFMLQQTQVATAIPYYERFMARFPTVESLAGAKEEEIFQYWSGLGYYRRAHSLHQTARMIKDYHLGMVPKEVELLKKLPGIGAYTAGAILSIAYNQPEALVDGNVERVYARLFGSYDDVSSSAGKKKIWQLAKAMISTEEPGNYNQALMELGARICLPENPLCLLCPISPHCHAFKRGTTDQLPVKNRRNKNQKILEVVLLVKHQHRWLLTNTNSEGIYRGLWQFPWSWQISPDEGTEAILSRLVSHFALKTGKVDLIFQTRHSVTFRSIQTLIYRTSIRKSIAGNHIRWVTNEQLNNLGLPSYQRKVLTSLEGTQQE